MEVKILSRETIKPSSPTPPHLKTFQLSLLDQLSPLVYTPLLFFYPIKDKHDNLKIEIATLKNSLSKTLTHFFLLAGRITNNNTSVCCSDQGAVFVEANVNCNMSQILKEPDSEILTKLLPCSVLCTEPVEEYSQIVAQANVFNCGGIVISICLLHKLMDATSMSCFLTFWASINKGSSFDSSFCNDIVCSNYKLVSSLFPQTNSSSFDHSSVQQAFSKCEKKRHFKRVVFKSKAISDLKAKSKSKDVPNPTSVEVLSGFIWKCIWEAASAPSILTHAVNLRKRITVEPSLREVCVGNIFWVIVAHYLAEEEKQVEVSELVSLLRHSFAEINGDYIQGSGDIVKLMKERKKLLCEAPKLCIFTSWRNIGFNEVDFGWGKPIWVATAGDSNVTKDNIVVLLDAISGDGVEVWILLDEEEMKLLEQNPEFLEFALLNPVIPLP